MITITGLIPFGVVKMNRAGSAEYVLLRGAFAAYIASGALPTMHFEHDKSRTIGRWTRLAEDDRGLVVTGELTDDIDPTGLGLSIGACGDLTEDVHGPYDPRGDVIIVLQNMMPPEISLCRLPAIAGARVIHWERLY